MSRTAAEANLEYVAEAFERWNAGEREIEFERIDPEVELHTPLASTRGAPYRGHEGFRQWIADIDEQFERWQLHADEWRILDDGVILALGEIRARGRESRIEIDQPLAWVFTFRDDRLLRYEVFFDPDEAFRNLGLSSA